MNVVQNVIMMQQKCRSTFSRWLWMLFVMILFVSCAPKDVEETAVFLTSSPANSEKTTLIIGLDTNQIVTLDPAAYSDRPTETVIRNIFDGLVTRTTENEIVPELASSYRWINDTTIDFILKENVVFHNGDPFTAQDVVFTFDRIQNQEVGAPRRVFAQGIERVEAIGDYTARFHLKYAWPVFLPLLAHTQIVPQAYITEVGDEAFARSPIGTGPFRFVSGTLDGEIMLARFENYYGGADALPPVAPPRLDTVIFRMIPQSDERLAALVAGDVHIIQNVPTTAVSTLATNTNITIKTTVGTRPRLIDLNVTRPPFDDVRVRQALQHAINIDAILQQVVNGYGIPMPGPLSPANHYADLSLQPYEFNPEQARRLLAEAGYAPEDILLTIDTPATNAAIADAIATQLRALGIQVVITYGDVTELRPLLLNCGRQAFLHDWGDSIFDPIGYIEAKWQTRDETSSAGRGNYACYSNAEVDALIEAGSSEANTQKRQDIYNEAQRLIYTDSPSLFLYVPQEIEAASTLVRNWNPSPDGRINLHDVWLDK